MRKAFVVVPSECVVDLSGDLDLSRITNTVIGHTVTVVTKDCVGEAAIVAGKIITSLLLVGNYRLVQLVVPFRGCMQAVVARRDEQNFLAELKPVMVARGSISPRSSDDLIKFDAGPIGAVDDPLLTALSKPGKLAVIVAGMSYIISVCGRKEDDFWKVSTRLPDGLVGGGIWDLNGRFVGLTLATKKPYHRMESDMMLAVPANTVMDFAETN
jgi:hypothetical protein